MNNHKRRCIDEYILYIFSPKAAKRSIPVEPQKGWIPGQVWNLFWVGISLVSYSPQGVKAEMFHSPSHWGVHSWCVCVYQEVANMVYLYHDFFLFYCVWFLARIIEPLLMKRDGARKDLLHSFQSLHCKYEAYQEQKLESHWKVWEPRGWPHTLPPNPRPLLVLSHFFFVLSSYFTDCFLTWFALVSPLSQKSKSNQMERLTINCSKESWTNDVHSTSSDQADEMPSTFNTRVTFSQAAQVPCFLLGLPFLFPFQADSDGRPELAWSSITEMQGKNASRCLEFT